MVIWGFSQKVGLSYLDILSELNLEQVFLPPGMFQIWGSCADDSVNWDSVFLLAFDIKGQQEEHILVVV